MASISEIWEDTEDLRSSIVEEADWEMLSAVVVASEAEEVASLRYEETEETTPVGTASEMTEDTEETGLEESCSWAWAAARTKGRRARSLENCMLGGCVFVCGGLWGCLWWW